MNIKNIVKEIYNNTNVSRKKALVMEGFFMTLIKLHIEFENKPFALRHEVTSIDDKGKKRRNIFAGYAPEGFDQFLEATAIEIIAINPKYSATAVYSRLQKFIENRYTQIDDHEVSNMIFILLADLGEETKERYTKNINLNYEYLQSKIHVWDFKELESLLKKHPEFLGVEENLLEFMLEVEIEQSVKSVNEGAKKWKIERDIHLNDLKQQYEKDNLVLFIGAGGSQEAKIATWDQLISDLLVALVSKKLDKLNVKLTDVEKSFVASKLKEMNGNSPLQLVRYIRNGLEDYFLKTTSEVLYKNALDTSPLLQEICKLCSPTRSGVGLQGVVTYNFDDLLERNLGKFELRHIPIYKEAQIPDKNELPIYHVHGFLPRNIEKYEDITEESLIFSEEGYHGLMLDSFNWSNLVQLNYFRERTCLFIGVSLTDPNIRRLLDIAMSKQPEKLCKHYIFMKRETFSIPKDSQDFNLSNIKKFEAVNHDQKERSFQELGLNIIWVEDYKEIPTLLKKIRE